MSRVDSGLEIREEEQYGAFLTVTKVSTSPCLDIILGTVIRQSLDCIQEMEFQCFKTELLML
jgi:hypothetical protein